MIKNKTILRAVTAVIATLIITYILDGAVFAFDEEKAASIKVIAAIGFISFVIAILTMFIISRNDKLKTRFAIKPVNIFDRNHRKEFCEFYNINRPDCIILISVLIVGFALRMIGYNWGLVGSWQPDECKLVNPAILMADTKLLYSDYVYYPAQFVTKFAAIPVYICARLKHLELSTATMIEAYFVVRVFSILLSTATIYTSFLIGNNIKKHLGSIMAVFMALFPYYVSLSKQVTGDIPVLFFLTLTMLFSLRYMDNKKNIYIILMSMGAAMATLEKWHGAVGIGYVGVVLLVSNDGVKDFIKKGFNAIISYYLWMLLFAPNIMINLKKTIIDGFINIAVYDGSEGYPYAVLLLNYIKYGFCHIGGIIYILLFALGMAYLIKNRSKKYLLLLVGILKILILCFLNRQYSRWGMELYFIEIMMISCGCMMLMDSSKKYLKAIGAAAMTVAVIDILSASVLVSVVASANDRDSRLVQRKDCKEASITPENMISQYYTGFGPSSWCDKEYPGTVIKVTDWSKYIIEDDGLYRTDDEFDYISLNLSQYDIDQKLADVLDTKCEKKFEYHTVCEDTFRIPFEYTDVSMNDVKVIAQNIRWINAVYKGGLIGDNIVVYDVSNLPVYE